MRLKGTSVSKGYGIGKARKVMSTRDYKYDIKASDSKQEHKRLLACISKYKSDTNGKIKLMQGKVSKELVDILGGRLIMVDDPFFVDSASNMIKDGASAEHATASTLQVVMDMFNASGDALTMQRVSDIRELSSDLVGILVGASESGLDNLECDTVLITDDVLPSMIVGDITHLVGIISLSGGYTSHSAIISRNKGIPAIFGCKDALDKISDGDNIIVDGVSGNIIVKPSNKDMLEYAVVIENYHKEQRELAKYKTKPTVTKDGTSVKLFANIGSYDELDGVIDSGAEGIGLYRTEFLYMEAAVLPSLDVQTTAYSKVASGMKGREVIIRTLDVGGDKEVPCINMPKEDNPFLGYRAIRYCLDNKDVFLVQLKAILKSNRQGNVKIMLPHITKLEEIREAKAVLAQARAELAKESKEYDRDIKLGIMIETAASLVICDILADEVDFFSIGTNDLTQYIMEADRGNSRVASYYSIYSVAVLRAIKWTIEAGKRGNIEVGMCGEAAADSLLIPLWIAYGLDEYSVSPKSILRVRKNLSQWTKAEADKVAALVDSAKTEQEIRDILTKYQK